jgi:hypothetical protein
MERDLYRVTVTKTMGVEIVARVFTEEEADELIRVIETIFSAWRANTQSSNG